MLQPAALYLFGVIALSALGVTALVALECLRPEGYNTAVIGQIIGLIGPSIIGLMVLIRSVANGQATETAIKKIDHAAGKAEEAVATAAAAPAATAQAVKSVLAENLPRGPIQVDATIHADALPKASQP